ncbi:MAG: FAD-dependent oxidoreductase [Gemmatimonadota bacterium]
MTYDVAVIGAGVFGTWIAWDLVQRGLRVALIDAHSPAHNRASSGGESRMIRIGYGPDEIYSRMARRSLARWEQLSAEAELPIFVKTGALNLVIGMEDYARHSSRILTGIGVRLEELSPSELAYRYPQIRLEGVRWGQLEPDSGALLARRGVQTLARRAMAAGASYLQESCLPPAGSKVTAVRTRSGTVVSAGTFVFAAGPWLAGLFPALLGSRLFVTRQEVCFFGIPAGDTRFAPETLPAWTDYGPDLHYGFPDLEGRGFKLAPDFHGPAFDPDTGNREVAADTVTRLRQFLELRFPALVDAPLVETRVCQYENTSNGDFLIDRHPEWDNVWLVGGGSGHGFKHGPAIGEYVTDHLTSTSPLTEPRFSLASKPITRQRGVY